MIEDLSDRDVPLVMELVGQEFVKEGYVDPMEPKKKPPKKKKKGQEEEVVMEERQPIQYQILKQAKMPHIEKIAIDVVCIQKEIYGLEYPNLKELRIKILEAPKF